MDSTESPRPGHKFLLMTVLALGLALRLGWALSRPADNAAIDLLPDQRGYLELGRNLLRGDGLHYFDARFGQEMYAARTPGYPMFIAACGGSVRATRAAQATIDASTALAAYLLARRLLRNERSPAPLFAAGFVAFNPFLVYFSALLLTETLYTAMLAWAMVVLLAPREWWLGIALLALGVLVRPSGVGLPALLAVTATLLRFCEDANRKRYRFIATVIAAVVGAVMTIAVLAPWAMRNVQALGQYIWTTTNDGITAYDGLHPGATGASDQRFVADMPQVKPMGEVERSEYFAEEARRFVWENPRRVVQLAFAKIARTWSPVPLSEEFGRPLYRVVALLFAVPLDLLALIGLFGTRFRRRAVLLLLLTPAAYFTAVHSMSVGSLRYRMPVEPTLAVLAGIGAAQVVRLKRK